jgi:hypothetical protein
VRNWNVAASRISVEHNRLTSPYLEADSEKAIVVVLITAHAVLTPFRRSSDTEGSYICYERGNGRNLIERKISGPPGSTVRGVYLLKRIRIM